MCVNGKPHKSWFMFTLEWIMCPELSLWLTRFYIAMQKRSSEKKYHPLSHLFETVILNQRLFSCCQSCRDSTSRSAKVERERCSRCKTPHQHFFVPLDNAYNLAISFNFSITNGHISTARRNHAALNLSHAAHSEKRSPEQSVMRTDLDLYYKWQWHHTK